MPGVLAELEAGRTPAAWSPLGRPRPTRATFLSPLDPVSARGRAKPLFGFDYVWEVYKPVEKRSFGYYTMPILWGDRLVARFDPKLDRATGTLVINGLWLEDPALARDVAFADAMARAMARFVALRRRAPAGRHGTAAVAPSNRAARVAPRSVSTIGAVLGDAGRQGVAPHWHTGLRSGGSAASARRWSGGIDQEEGDTVEIQRDAARLGTIATIFIWVGWLAVLYSFIAGILWWIDLAQREAFNFLEAFAISAAAIGVPLFLALIVAAAGHALRLFASYVSGRPQ